ncbi:type 1 glutamine amidotransferase [uncultured Tateyamaria sp.]|uniref:type 1 glutamine amidotransferase n=1 Tax=uncultured Tateyamaria sp. TaxID=455651 RepID=UPI00261F5306|nr:type 1 glutamine amidotransferase [uncultured Tateyamaria sp.]
MKIGILQTGHAPDEVLGTLGDYDAMFARLLDGHGFDFETFKVVDMDFPSGPDICDGWLVTGSKHGAYEDHPFIPPLEALIRDIHTSGRPMIGVCFGHQIIAQAMGGTVEKFAGGWSVGRREYDYKGETISVNAWHQDQVIAVPPGAEVIGSSAFCANAALVYGNRIWTIQPHPEFGADMVEALATHRAPGVVPDPLIEEARAQLDIPTHRHKVAADMVAFLKQGALVDV